MKRLGYMVAAAWIAVGVIELPLEAQGPADARVQRAEGFIRQLESGAWAAADAMVGPRMRQAGVTSQMLEQTWQQLTAAAALSALKFDSATESGEFYVVDFIATFGSVSHRFRISLDAEQRVEGFRLFPVAAPAAHPLPPYAQPAAYEEQELTVGAEGWPLGATLTLPKGAARAPVVVLVHGSGSHDRDETLGPSKPFRDLAVGLASLGVGVLRYEKRTWKHGARLVAQPGFTVEDEVIADALAAVAQVRAHPRVDPARVYVLGHSLGGMLAPEIAAREGKLAGVILLAGTPRRLTELVVEQLTYLKTLPENAIPAAQQQMAEMIELMGRLEREEVPPAEQAMGAPASYYYDLAKRPPLDFLRRVRAPVLVLQGGRDYQVTEQDFELLRQALAGRSDARFHLYPDLNHLFVTGEGKAKPAEYMQAGHVDARVVQDIAAFVQGR